MKLSLLFVKPQKIRCLKKAILFLGILLTVQHINAQEPAWSYVGIPYTDWNYDPFTIELEKPSAWPSNALENYYYIAPDHPNATDEISNGEPTDSKYGRYGYPDRPRKSIPTGGWIGDVFPAGTVIWLKGGYYDSSNFYDEWSPQFHGTASQQVWIHGDADDKPTFNGNVFRIFRSTHTIVENIQWIGGNKQNGVISLTRDRSGPTHHMTLRHLLFENLNHISGGGPIVGFSASRSEDAELHDVVSYKNVFKNCGGGYDWSTEDRDHHGYKVSGILDGNHVYKIWVIDNKALKGDAPDPADGLFKSISGNLVQVGDVGPTGGNHHVFVAGNYQEFARQALGWTKQSSDVIFSSNYCTDTYALKGGNGQCYGHQYGLGDHNWWINNVGTKSASGWMHTANDPMKGPLFIIGNQFYNNRNSESNDNWRACSGISLFSQYGEHYIVNNLIDNSCHGIWAATNRHSSSDKLHIYNNIFTNISATIDATSKPISIGTEKNIAFFIENNLFDTYDDNVQIERTQYSTLAELNTQDWANNNIVGDPLFIDPSNGNYNLKENSPAIDAGTQSYKSGAPDVYQLYIDRYKNDPLYPGNPADYWPKDYLGNNRVAGGVIDIGPYEFDADIFVPEPENPNPEDPNTPDPTPSETIIISPNPTQGEFSITMGTEQSVWAIIVYNELGKLITIADGNTVDLAQYPKGIYIVKILTTDKKVFSRKVLKY